MNILIKFQTALVVLLMTAVFNSYAQQTSDVEKTVNEIVKKHEGSEGVNCIAVVKGSGLEMIKFMFNKEFGKGFMKGVTSITIIEYSDAPEETCMTLRKDLDVFLSLLQEYDISEEEQFADNDYLRCFVSVADDKTLSDFVIAIEDDDAKMIIYMAGEIKIE